MYGLLVIGFCVLAGVASIGYVLGGLLALNRLHEMQAAYQRLSHAIRNLLGDCADAECGMLILCHDDLTSLRQTLDATDALMGWTIEDLRR
jgi:hypothetical protein